MKSIFVLFIFLISPKLSAQEATVATPLGHWEISGKNSLRGNYTGELEIRQTADGSYQATRIVSYTNFKYKGLNIQEIWTGFAALNGDELHITFSVKNADFLNQVDDVVRTQDQFLSPNIVVTVYIPTTSTQKSNSMMASFSIAGASDENSEKLFNKTDILPEPIWQNLRSSRLSRGEYLQFIIWLGKILVLDDVVAQFQKSSQLDAFRARPEFMSQNQYFVTDPTDYDFYQKNKTVLRVENKVIDPISLAESIAKRNAYAYTIDEKAEKFEKDLQKYNLNETGMISFGVTDAQRNLVGYQQDGDSALWTGMYASVQAMRYLTTHDPQALELVKKTTRAIFDLIDITGNPQHFARTMQAYKPGMEIPHDWHQGTGKYSNVLWVQNDNNDMFKGLATAMIWAYVSVPKDDTQFWAELKDHALKMPQLKLANKGSVNGALANGLAALLSGDQKYEDEFVRHEESFLQVLNSALDTEAGFYYGGTADWSGINLTMVTTVAQIMVADQLVKNFQFKDEPIRQNRAVWSARANKHSVENILDHQRKVMLKQWNTYAQTRRDFLTIAAYTFAYKNVDPDYDLIKKKKEQWQQSVNSAIWTFREMPYPKPECDAKLDFRSRPDWSVSAWPRIPWKGILKLEVDDQLQGAYSYPLFEQSAWLSNFILKDDPFSFRGDAQKNVIKNGDDYLYMYWMARWSGFFNEINPQ